MPLIHHLRTGIWRLSAAKIRYALRSNENGRGKNGLQTWEARFQRMWFMAALADSCLAKFCTEA